MKNLKKILGYLLLTLLVGTGIFLIIPSNYYIHGALIHLMPKIDQYTIFENRIVKADDPQPWEFARDVDKKQIPAEFVADFNKYETVAFVVIQHNKIIFEQY